MAQARGSKAKLFLGIESAYGTPAGNLVQMPITPSVSLALDQPLIRSNRITGNRNKSRPELDEKTVSGSFGQEGDPRALGWPLLGTLGTVATTGTGPYTHKFTVADELPSFFIEKQFANIAKTRRYVGCVFNGLSASPPTGQFLELNFDVIGQDEIPGTALFDATPTVHPHSGLRNAAGTLLEGGAGLLKATSISFQITNNAEPQKVWGNAGKIAGVAAGDILATGELAVMFEDETYYDKARNETESSLKLVWAFGAHSFAIEFPEIRYAVSSPPIDTPSGISAKCRWEAFYENGTDGSSVVATLINDIASYASIP